MVESALESETVTLSSQSALVSWFVSTPEILRHNEQLQCVGSSVYEVLASVMSRERPFIKDLGLVHM